MAIREPVYYDAGTDSIRKFSSEQIDQIISECVYQYSLDPSVTLSVADSTGTSLTAITDTRYQAGASSTDVSAFPTEATTAEPSIVTVTYQRINQSVASITPVTDTTTLWPAYFTSGENLQAMTLQDVKDTFLHPAIDLLTSASTSSTNQGGTYTISSSDTLADHTLVSATPVFLDTRVDIAQYTAAAIPEAQDQPITINSYYLHKRNGAASSVYTNPVFLKANGDVQVYSTENFSSYISDWIRYTAASSTDGYKITYNINGSGNTRGTSMINTRFEGEPGDYQTFQAAGEDDYRAQEFPSTTTVIEADTYNLKILKS
jgi:hypothetical protein